MGREIILEHRCENHQWITNEVNLITLKTLGWQSQIHPRNIKMVQYTQINKHDIPHQQDG
jgi:hypothetical protein